ncbi:transposase [Bradyrhizobium sp. Pha-3]|uniref:REP-associated tyrosine transposase n=1 Tax=Bradyrhizobium sp. Pha-3 TaxID=208375 RepID=UPI0035D41597
MVRYRRNFIPGGMFFFTVTLEDRTSSLLVEHVGLLRDAFRATRAKKPFTLDAIVILPDHLHTVMTLPPGDSDFPDRWRQIKSHFTRAVVAAGVPLSANHRAEYPLWQRRFWEYTIRNERDLERCIDYVHYNPAKHRLASSPVDWQHTSLHRYIREGILPADWGGGGATDNNDFGERKD